MQPVYDIGQVVYILDNESQTVLPGIIREQIHHKSIDAGESVSYKLGFGPPAKQKVVNLSDLNGQIYTDLDDIRADLTIKLQQFIDNLTSVAKQRAESWYNRPVTVTPPITEQSQQSSVVETLSSLFSSEEGSDETPEPLATSSILSSPDTARSSASKQKKQSPRQTTVIKQSVSQPTTEE